MTSLQNQLSWCVKAQWTLAIAMIAMLLGFYFAWYRPEHTLLRERRAAIESKRVELEANGTRASNLHMVKLEVDNLRARLERFNKKLPKQQDLGQFIRDITTVSQQSSLRKLTVQPGAPKRTALYTEMPISLNFEGDFNSVFNFLRQTEDMQRLTRVNNLSVKTTDAKLGQVEVQVSMNIYFSEG
jgi:Tfp pilus assembly protein PilO